MIRRTATTSVLLFLAGCRIAITPHVVLIDIASDPAFTRVDVRPDGTIVLDGAGTSMTQRQALVGVVEGAVRAVVK
jgi:hypothetical protein